MRELTFAFVGAGGDGAVASGDIIATACASRGLHVIKTEAYGPQIRGGESSSTVRVSSKPLSAQSDAVDVVVVFSWADFARFCDELTLADDAVVFHDPADAPPEGMERFKLFAVPFGALAREAGAPAAKNIVGVATAAAAFRLPLDAIRSAIMRRFGKKAAAVIESNLRAFDRGVVEGSKLETGRGAFEYESAEPKLMMTGNEAAAFGALHAGCSFFAGYPITPSSEVLHFLADWLPKSGGTALQTEDELAAIGAVIGASFAGAKSMTATSGPGLSLMSELLGLSSIAEIPSVIYNVQRGGPSTGIPTKSEQSDLMHSVFGSHGDTPRVVLTCTDVESTFHATVDAFNIAEEFQVPVILLTEQSIAQRRQTVDEKHLEHEVRDRRYATTEEMKNYRRYRLTEDGVSPMSIPGMAGGIYQTNGLEHDEQGRPASTFVQHETMNQKRYRKAKAIAQRYRLFDRFGAEKPDVGILCWGASVGVAHEAIAQLGADGKRLGVFAPRILDPLPVEDLQAFVDSCRSLFVFELSFSKQFYRYLRTEIDMPRGTTVFSRSGGKNLSASEVVAALRPLLARQKEEVLA